MTVRQNLGYGLKARRTPKPEIARRVDEVAAMLGLEQLLDRRPAQLSGGQRQRVAMGRAIVRHPQAFLARRAALEPRREAPRRACARRSRSCTSASARRPST
jgi:ABC-type sugar transport systems, ATPase components